MNIPSHVGVKQLEPTMNTRSKQKSAGVNNFKHFFFVWIIKPWNNLPNNVFEGGICVKGFKSRPENTYKYSLIFKWMQMLRMHELA